MRTNIFNEFSRTLSLFSPSASPPPPPPAPHPPPFRFPTPKREKLKNPHVFNKVLNRQNEVKRVTDFLIFSSSSFSPQSHQPTPTLPPLSFLTLKKKTHQLIPHTFLKAAKPQNPSNLTRRQRRRNYGTGFWTRGRTIFSYPPAARWLPSSLSRPNGRHPARDCTKLTRFLVDLARLSGPGWRLPKLLHSRVTRKVLAACINLWLERWRVSFWTSVVRTVLFIMDWGARPGALRDLHLYHLHLSLFINNT